MKRIIALLFVFVLLFCTVGCGAEPPSPPALPVATPTPTPAPTEKPLTGNPFLDADVILEPVKSGTGTSTIGTRAKIEIDKDAAKSATQEEYSQFLKERVDGSGYNWWSVCFEDGTGIFYAGSLSFIGEYGKLDAADDTIVESYGMITPNDDGEYFYDGYTDEPEPVEPSDELKGKIETLLTNMFNLGNGVSTLVDIDGSEANVFMMGNFSVNSETEKEEFTTALMELYDSAKGLIETNVKISGEDVEFVLSTTIFSSAGVPLYSIVDGEVTFDIL